MQENSRLTRRQFLTSTAVCTGFAGAALDRKAADADKALISITLDLEMSRNFPTRDEMRWDFEKGNLNDETKQYTVEACRRVKAKGGVLHCFAVGRVFEQESVDWLKRIVEAGHPVGNHTYDHVNVLATKAEDIQFRFQRSPWLIAGRNLADVIRDNVRLTNLAMRTRIGLGPSGFRTPGGFPDGLRNRPDVRAMLRQEGFDWISSLYPSHKNSRPGEAPGTDVRDDIVAAQPKAQPFVYPDGLVEIPMSPISDIGAFRNGRWKLPWFLDTVRLGVEWAIENRAVYDFLGHPSCLYVTDPEFRAIDLICDLVRKAGDRAKIVGLDTVADRARVRS
jgi:peptidoglycan/xylan/chitin deacetylase (PgdA/CDA1 family)